jgi:acyl carrier protein
VAAEELTPDSGPGTVEGWDSLQQLNLVLAIEQEFELQLGPEDIERLGNIRLIAAVVACRLGTIAALEPRDV